MTNSITEWTPYEFNTDITTTLDLINFSLAEGFEFKVENHTLYFRELVS